VHPGQGIDTLVIASDGSVRLLPFGALHDGERFVIERFAVTTVTGMSMTNGTPRNAESAASALISGVATPGPVLGKLPPEAVSMFLTAQTQQARADAGVGRARALRGRRTIPQNIDASERAVALAKAMTLPRVRAEVEGVARATQGVSLLDSDFTIDRFRGEAESGRYRIVHIASHGIFGGAADNSYILAYDDYITMDGLREWLKADTLRSTPVDLLTLSACETADGSDRAPLGIAGAAMKARARSVMGALWQVEDTAAQTLMQKFYEGLLQRSTSKAEALRRAQLELLNTAEFSHPFFWAPFVLIGNWQ
jgi:CHAT domain-containing protein